MTRLLIVDDDEQNLYLMQTLLHAEGYEIFSAMNGAEALTAAHRDLPDIVISDILMPGMDGLALCRAWKNDERLRAIPFVFYTATYTDPRDEEFALSLGAARFIRKPAEPDAFVRILRDVIQAHQTGQLTTPRQPVEAETIYFKEYNTALIRKLEDKMLELEEANRNLTEQVEKHQRAQEKLAYQANLLENVNDAIIAADAEFRLTAWNAAAENLYGWKAAEVLGQNGLKIVQTEWINQDAEVMRRTIAETGRWKGEATQARKDGTRIPVEISSLTIRDEQGHITGYVSMNRDLTERKHAEDQLRQSQELFSNAFYASPAALTITRIADGKFIDANESFLRLFEFDREQVVGHTSTELNMWSVEERRKLIQRQLAAGGLQNVELIAQSKSGKPIDVLFSSKPVEINGQVCHITTLIDITERKQSAHERQIFAMLADSSSEFIGMCDLDLNPIYVNPAGVRMVGLPDLTAACRVKVQDYFFPEDQQFIAQDFFPRVMREGHGEVEIRLRHFQTGAAIWVFYYLFHVRDASGALVGWATVSRDITERKQAEQALRGSEERLRLSTELANVAVWEYDFHKNSMSRSNNHDRLYGLDWQTTWDINTFLNATHPDDRALSNAIIQKSVAVGGPDQYSFDFRVISSDQSVHWLNVIGQVVERNAAGQGMTVRGCLIDITARKRAEDQVRQRAAELEAVNRISTALRAAQTLDEMLPLLLDEILAVLNTNTGMIELANHQLRPNVARGWITQIVEPPMEKGEGIAGHVYATGEAYRAREFASDPRTRESTREQVMPGWGGVCVPIRTTEAIVGVMFIAVQLPRELTADEIRLLTTLSEIAGSAIHRMRLHEQTERQVNRLAALHTIDTTISSSLDLRITLNLLLEQVLMQLRVDAACVLLFNPHLNTLEFAAGRGFRGSSATRLRLRLGEDYAGQAALERRVVSIPNLKEAARPFTQAHLTESEDFITYYGAPLVAKSKIKGVLEIFHRTPLAPDAEWLSFFETLAGQAAIAIDDAALFDDLQRANTDLAMAYDSTLEGWSRALDLRDKETEGHTQRVVELTIRLARSMGFSDADLMQIRRGALLHDIGKMGVPDGILLKPNALTEDEWVVMRKHPEYAYQLLAPIAYLRPALDVPYCHHEKWDGTGYPRGLKGTQIPLAARIFALVDVWDALTSDRPYRPAWSLERAREYIRANAGTHFDPQVVETFLNLI